VGVSVNSSNLSTRMANFLHGYDKITSVDNVDNMHTELPTISGIPVLLPPWRTNLVTFIVNNLILKDAIS